MGQRDSSLESASTTTSQTPCVTTSIGCRATTHSVQAGHVSVQVPSSHGAVLPSRHVHSCVVYNWSSTSPFCFPSWSDNSTQSIDAIWITQLRHLALRSGTRYHWLFATWALHSLVSAADLKLNCTSKHMMDTQHPRDRSLYKRGRLIHSFIHSFTLQVHSHCTH